MFHNIFPQFVVTAYSGMPTNDTHMYGRPYGGLAIACRYDKIKLINDFGLSINNRAQGLCVEIAGKQYLVFNVYFPCKGDSNYVGDIAIICAFMSTVKNSVNSNVEILIAGDFNFDLRHILQNSEMQIFSEFLNDNHMEPCSLFYNGNTKYTFRCETRNVHSFIDNVVIPKSFGLQGHLLSVDIVDDVVNNSDHLAITCEVVCNSKSVQNIDVNKPCYYQKIIWSDQVKLQYYVDTGVCFQNIIDYYQSSIINCNCDNAESYVSHMFNDIVNLLVACSASHKKIFAQRGIKWNNRLNELKKNSRVAMQAWRDSGCPVIGSIHDEYVSCKKEYKKAIKEVKRNDKRARGDRLLDAWRTNDTKKFWNIWRSNSSQLRNNDVLQPDSFVDVFRGNFINSASNVKAVNNFNALYNKMFVDNSCDKVQFNVEEIEKAVKSLKQSQTCDCNELTIMHILYSHPAIYVALKILFNTMLFFGVVPNGFGSSVITPVVKSKEKSFCDATNYRPVSIITVFSKVFEACLLVHIEPMLLSHSNQFGFVKNGGCNKAVYMFTSTVKYFIERNSNVYICALDASKAFDRVNHYFLLTCLIERGVPKCIVDVLYAWFRNMNACVKWNGSFSSFFNVLSGVPEGSLLGPRLYNIVMDKLLVMLENSGLGCHIAGLFAGAVAYADDLIILSASVIKLQFILDMCVEFGKTCDLEFNCDKSLCGVVGQPELSQQASLLIGNKSLKWVNSFVYLGIEFVLGSCLKVNCRKRIQKFMGSVSSVLQCKCYGYEDVFAEILIKKCLPILMYGLDCVTLDSNSVKIVTQAWNCAFRWLYGVGKYTSTRHLFEQHNTMSMKFLLDCSLMSFFACVSKCYNCLLQKLILHTVNDPKIRCMFEHYNVSDYTNVHSIKRNVRLKFCEYCDDGDG
jgi:hypothetical protein